MKWLPFGWASTARIAHSSAALSSQQGRDAPIAVTAVLARQVDDRGGQRLLVWSRYGLVSLCRARLTQHMASTTLGHTIFWLDMVDAVPAALGAYQFPSAASFKISLSKVRSATARLSRLFSCSRTFSRRA